ncbi:Glycosyl transferase WecB/TagA/CpsF family protein [compost metagenome]
MPDLLRLSEVENIPVFFYGGTQEMLGLTEDFLQENYPNLIIAGMISPPFRALTTAEESNFITIINESGA